MILVPASLCVAPFQQQPKRNPSKFNGNYVVKTVQPQAVFTTLTIKGYKLMLHYKSFFQYIYKIALKKQAYYSTPSSKAAFKIKIQVTSYSSYPSHPYT